MWVLLEEVHMQVWHEIFFVYLGNNWGSFVSLDDDTFNRRRFDIARMLVLMESRLRIPSPVTVKVKGISLKILISVEQWKTLN